MAWQPRMFGQVDLAHSAGAEQAHDPEASKSLTAAQRHARMLRQGGLKSLQIRCCAMFTPVVRHFHRVDVVRDDGDEPGGTLTSPIRTTLRGRPRRRRPPRRTRRPPDGLRKIGSQSPRGIA